MPGTEEVKQYFQFAHGCTEAKVRGMNEGAIAFDREVRLHFDPLVFGEGAETLPKVVFLLPSASYLLTVEDAAAYRSPVQSNKYFANRDLRPFPE